ncbi:MAG: choice-of-anchor Q domain-containing protein [Candidatus Binatia bacterium]
MIHRHCLVRALTCLGVLALLMRAPRAGTASNPAPQLVLFVDGGCSTSGDGTTLTCGATGPFRTISEGVTAMTPGTALYVRGAHGTFDGVYHEYVGIWGTDTDAYPGKNLNCTATQPCVIEGCPADACSADERPTLSGLVQRRDWEAAGTEIWKRTMESRANEVAATYLLDDYAPGFIAQGTSRTHLSYAGDNVKTPGEGTWSYDTTTHTVYVNPVGARNPNTDRGAELYVPDHKTIVAIIGDEGSPHSCLPGVSCLGAHHLTLRRLRLEGGRWTGLDIFARFNSNGSIHRFDGIRVEDVQIQDTGAIGFVGGRFVNLVVNNVDTEYIGRGTQTDPTARPAQISSFGVRLFHVDGGVLTNLIGAHLGEHGGVAKCPWCDAPWNTAQVPGGKGSCLDLKQSRNVVVDGLSCTDVAGFGVQNDVSHDVEYAHLTVTRVGQGFSDRVFTPDEFPGIVCPCTSNYNVTLRDSSFTDAGTSSDGNIVIYTSPPPPSGSYGARIYNNFISYSARAAVAIQQEFGAGGSAAEGISIWNNSIHSARAFKGYGAPTNTAPAGIFVDTDNASGYPVSTLTNVGIRNNIFEGQLAGGISIPSNITHRHVTADYNLYWGNTPAVATWFGTTYTTTTGFCAARGQECHGSEADPRFADASTADLHLQPGSAAQDAGVPLAAFATDIDAEVRPMGATWDVGADEAGGPVPTACPSNLQAGCRTAARSLFVLRRNASNENRDGLIWRWKRGQATSKLEFGDPTGLATSYALCLYDANGLVPSTRLPAHAQTWSVVRRTRLRYRDLKGTHDGLRRILLRPDTATKAKIVVLGRGASLPDPTLPLTPPVTVQLTNSQTPVCWEATYSGSRIKKNELGLFRGRIP